MSGASRSNKEARHESLFEKSRRERAEVAAYNPYAASGSDTKRATSNSESTGTRAANLLGGSEGNGLIGKALSGIAKRNKAIKEASEY